GDNVIVLLLVLIVLMMFRPLRLLIGSLFVSVLVVVADVAGTRKGVSAEPGLAFLAAQIGYWGLIAAAAHSRRSARRQDIERAVRDAVQTTTRGQNERR
ncbi:MAG: hypothetical protein ACYCSN_18910, partial [Acidobacteriaceae bacterium]